jgi:antitoxin component of RelBE/YafQ-DinJ toxin-antitoxin module
MAKNNNVEYPEIRITNVAKDLREDLNTIASNLGITTNQFLRMRLREIANSYPPNMKTKKE